MDARKETSIKVNKKNEIVEGVKGNGDTKYMVVTINADTGAWIWTEDFDRKAEAESWLKYSC